jgi:putative membrane protein
MISMGRTFLRFYGLKAQLEPEAIEIETGLLKRSYDRVPVRKVQFVEWGTNPLRKLAGFESARIHPTNPVGAANKQKVEIPALRPKQSRQLADGIYPGYNAPKLGFKADAAAYARIAAIVLSFGLLPLTAVLFYEFSFISLGLLSMYLPVIFFTWQYGRRVRIFFDHRFMLICKGWIFPSRVVLPLHKLQSVAVSSNIFLKRRGLCHLNLYTAAGSRTVRYLSVNEAEQLSDYLLWCVERSEEDWM